MASRGAVERIQHEHDAGLDMDDREHDTAPELAADAGEAERGPAPMAPAPEDVAALADAVAARDGPALVAQLTAAHPADAADLVEQLATEQITEAALHAPGAFTGPILVELAPDALTAAVAPLEADALAAAVRDLDTDDITYLVSNLDAVQRAAVLAAIPERERRAVEEALAFDEETAGRLTQREVVALPEFWTAGQAIDHMRQAGASDLPEAFFEVYVVDPSFRPVGAIPLSDFLRHPRSARLTDIMRAPQILVTPETDQEDAAYLINKYHLAQAPVVDGSGRLKGMITLDDVVEVIQEESEEDLLALAGVNEGGVGSSALGQVRARAPWLAVNLVTALAASLVISLFEETLEQVVALAILMPIVAALGGNVGGQALAVAVRALASRELGDGNARRMVAREALAALINGVGFATVLAVVAGIWFSSLEIAYVIGLALLANFVCGGLAGILVPLGLRRIGADPAVASSVFVSTLTDVVGFCIFLGLATAVLV